MKGYLPIDKACAIKDITLYVMEKLIDEGKVRAKESINIGGGKNAKLLFVCLQDVTDALMGVDLPYIDIGQVEAAFGITPRVVRFHIGNHRFRWRRDGQRLQPCISDLEAYIRHTKNKPAGRSKSAIGSSA